MQWACALSCHTTAAAAAAELEDAVRRRLGASRPDLVMVFVSPYFAAEYDWLLDALHRRLDPGALLGCSGAGVVGAGRQVEAGAALTGGGTDRAAVSVLAGVLPRVQTRLFHLEETRLPTADAPPEEWHEALGVPPEPTPHFVLLADFDPRPLLMGLDFAYPDAPKIGGLASVVGDNALFLDRRQLSSGCVGLALQGDIALDTVVAQGCKAIGPTHTVTACRHNQLLQLDGRPALEVLTQLYYTQPEAVQQQMRRALHLGVAATELQARFGPGDFLIRDLRLEQERDTLFVGDLLRQGQTVQFHLRDAEAATAELERLLGRPQAQTAGALLFSCVGRSEASFGVPDHDAGLFAARCGDVPLGGFLCGGEIGPLKGVTHLHGYTSVFGLFGPAAT